MARGHEQRTFLFAQSRYTPPTKRHTPPHAPTPTRSPMSGAAPDRQAGAGGHAIAPLTGATRPARRGAAPCTHAGDPCNPPAAIATDTTVTATAAVAATAVPVAQPTWRPPPWRSRQPIPHHQRHHRRTRKGVCVDKPRALARIGAQHSPIICAPPPGCWTTWACSGSPRPPPRGGKCCCAPSPGCARPPPWTSRTTRRTQRCCRRG